MHIFCISNAVNIEIYSNTINNRRETKNNHTCILVQHIHIYCIPELHKDTVVITSVLRIFTDTITKHIMCADLFKINIIYRKKKKNVFRFLF